jgi:hypothetical protein
VGGLYIPVCTAVVVVTERTAGCSSSIICVCTLYPYVARVGPSMSCCCRVVADSSVCAGHNDRARGLYPSGADPEGERAGEVPRHGRPHRGRGPRHRDRPRGSSFATDGWGRGIGWLMRMGGSCVWAFFFLACLAGADGVGAQGDLPPHHADEHGRRRPGAACSCRW